MLTYYPHKPIKGQSFTIKVACPEYNSSMNFIDASISKDGGTFAAVANVASAVAQGGQSDISTKGWLSLVLTATEMNADVVCVAFRWQSNLNTRIVIETTLSELSSVPTLNSSISDKITAIFQYLFGKRTVTATTETLYKDNGTDVLGTSTVSDDDVTVTKGKIA